MSSLFLAIFLRYWISGLLLGLIKLAKQTKTTKTEKEGTFVSSYLLYLLAAASEAASAQFHLHVRSLGLRVPEWRVLACLTDQDGLMITRLADLALMEQSRLTRIIDQMDKRGLLERRVDIEDGRRFRIYLTDEGRDLSTKLVEEAKVHEKQLLGILEDTDAARIKPVLQALLNSLET